MDGAQISRMIKSCYIICAVTLKGPSTKYVTDAVLLSKTVHLKVRDQMQWDIASALFCGTHRWDVVDSD